MVMEGQDGPALSTAVGAQGRRLRGPGELSVPGPCAGVDALPKEGTAVWGRRRGLGPLGVQLGKLRLKVRP